MGNKERDAGEKRNKKKGRKKEERGRKRKEGEKRKERRWKGTPAKNRKAKRVAAKTQGVGKQNSQGKLGQTLGFEVRWAWAGFGLLSRVFSKHFYFAKLFWQLNFENGDDCLDKYFSDNFRKIKIGFIKK